jgi:SAM-dependent methyltransferase
MTTHDRGDHDAGTPAASDPIPPEARAANLALWNRWTRVHEKSDFYDVEGFKAGATSLWPLEREELGPFVHEGTTVLHLQCHFGLDTLSWARLGARVVGLDFSDEAIALARRLADETGFADRAEFVCADVYDAGAHLDDRLFDVVFVSWGAVEWLPDLRRWAKVIARHLRPGGTFYMAEIHPFATALDEVPGTHDVQVKYRLLPAPDAPDVDAVEGSYADRDADTAGLTAYGWTHSFAEIIGALTEAGLRLEHLREFPTAPAPFWDWMVRDDDRWWWLPDGGGGRRKDLPLSYSLRASKPEGETAAADQAASAGKEA